MPGRPDDVCCWRGRTDIPRKRSHFRFGTHLRHWPDRNSAVQQSRTPPWCVLFSTPAVHGPAAPLSIHNNSGLSQGLAGRSAAGSACGKPTNGAKARGSPMFGIRQREFISLIGGAATAWPLAARAQRRAKPARIGYLSSSSPPDIFLESFIKGMGVVGYGEGRDFVLEARYVERDYNKFPALADELLRAQVDVIVAGGPAFRTWRPGAVSVSVVFLFSGDPVDAGIVASFARPGGNVTGVSLLSLDLSMKRVDLLKEAMPTMTRVAVLSNLSHPGEASELRATREAARALGLAIEHFEVGSDDDFEPAFAAIAQGKCDGLIAFPDALKNFNREKIVGFALRRRLPSIYGWKMYAEAGGLMSYGPVLDDVSVRVAVYVDKILKGVKPADLPVEQPTKLEVVVNLKTAKALGLEIPRGMILGADALLE